MFVTFPFRGALYLGDEQMDKLPTGGGRNSDMHPLTIGDRYQIQEKIGVKGANVVYDAVDTERSREVSVRRLAEASPPGFPVLSKSALREEARTLAGLKHPNFVDVFDCGEDDEGFYLVTEKLPGVNLERALAREVLSTEDFADFAGQTLEIVRALHEADIFGMEFHPRNFVLCRQPDGGFLVKILSLGMPDPEGTLEARSRRADSQLFSLIDTRADFLSLGRVFYQALTGIRPCGDEFSKDLIGSSQLQEIHHCKSRRPDVPMTLCSWVMSFLRAEDLESSVTVDEMIGCLGELDPEIDARFRAARERIARTAERSRQDTEAEEDREVAPDPFTRAEPAYNRSAPGILTADDKEGVILSPPETDFIVDSGEDDETGEETTGALEMDAARSVARTTGETPLPTINLHVLVLLALLALSAIAWGMTVLLHKFSGVGGIGGERNHGFEVAITEDRSRLSGAPRVHAPSSAVPTQGISLQGAQEFSVRTADVTVRSGATAQSVDSGASGERQTRPAPKDTAEVETLDPGRTAPGLALVSPEETSPGNGERESKLALERQLADARFAEVSGDFGNALRAYLAIVEQFPKGREHLASAVRVIEKLSEQPPELIRSLEAELGRAADAGISVAMRLLGESHASAESAARAVEWFRKAIAHGDVSSMTQLGLSYSRGVGVEKDLKRAFMLFRQAAESEDREALYLVGECYVLGKGVDAAPEVGLHHLAAAAGQGDPRAMDLLGVCHVRGLGVEKDYEKAFEYFSRAAGAGYVNALANLGVLWMEGLGVAKSPARGIEYFRKGAETFDPNCMFLYAKCLETGLGTQADASTATTWYLRAAEKGNPPAREWCHQHGLALSEAAPEAVGTAPPHAEEDSFLN